MIAELCGIDSAPLLHGQGVKLCDSVHSGEVTNCLIIYINLETVRGGFKHLDTGNSDFK